MKKIISLMVMLGALGGFTACNLDLEPDTSITGDRAGQPKYVESLRYGLYNNVAILTSYGNIALSYADYYTDLFNETSSSGNRGGLFSRWLLYANDADVQTIWSNYYSVILQINYSIEKADEAIANYDSDDEMNLYKGEFYFFRAYMMHQLALRFCEDYNPDTAASQLGVPYPMSYSPGAQMPRGTLADTYKYILEDIARAEQLVTTAGSQNSKYLTVDAITAFKAQVALQMHDYQNAITYASSLYGTYPLASSKADLQQMWFHDTSSEIIFECDLTQSTAGMISPTTDYSNGTYSSSGTYSFNPSYVPEQWVCDLYDAADYRDSVYVGRVNVRNATRPNDVKIMMKLLGNEELRTDPAILNYYNMPKLFRISEMYMIEAEAQYRLGGDAATPLNALRQNRGLAATTASGDALFQEIKTECAREFIGEGRRLFDLKRWGDGFTRDGQVAIQNLLTGGVAIYNMTVDATNLKFVWPIPEYELQNNPYFGNQNPGYAE